MCQTLARAAESRASHSREDSGIRCPRLGRLAGLRTGSGNSESNLCFAIDQEWSGGFVAIVCVANCFQTVAGTGCSKDNDPKPAVRRIVARVRSRNNDLIHSGLDWKESNRLTENGAQGARTDDKIAKTRR